MHEFCARFAAPDVPHTVSIGKRRFYDPRGLKRLSDEKGWDAFSVGVLIGDGDRPTPALLGLLKTERVVKVSDEAAWLVICGNDVLMEGVKDAGQFPVGTTVLIADLSGNVLGYGDVRAPFDAKKAHMAYVKTRMDLGDYLRREKS